MLNEEVLKIVLNDKTFGQREGRHYRGRTRKVVQTGRFWCHTCRKETCQQAERKMVLQRL